MGSMGMQRHLKHIHPELGIAPPKSMDTSERRDLKLSDSDFTEESNLVQDSIHLDAEDSDVKEPNIKEELSASNIENSSITSIDNKNEMSFRTCSGNASITSSWKFTSSLNFKFSRESTYGELT